MVQTNFYISDLALYSRNKFIFLTYDNSSLYIHLIKVYPNFQELSFDSVVIEDLKKNQYSDLRLYFNRDEGLLLAIGPNLIVKGIN